MIRTKGTTSSHRRAAFRLDAAAPVPVLGPGGPALRNRLAPENLGLLWSRAEVSAEAVETRGDAVGVPVVARVRRLGAPRLIQAFG